MRISHQQGRLELIKNGGISRKMSSGEDKKSQIEVENLIRNFFII